MPSSDFTQKSPSLPQSNNSYSVKLRILLSRTQYDISALMGAYQTRSCIRTHTAQRRITVVELVYLAQEVWRYGRGVIMPVTACCSWFVGHTNKILLNSIWEQDASLIVSMFQALLYAAHSYVIGRMRRPLPFLDRYRPGCQLHLKSWKIIMQAGSYLCACF